MNNFANCKMNMVFVGKNTKKLANLVQQLIFFCFLVLYLVF